MIFRNNKKSSPSDLARDERRKKIHSLMSLQESPLKQFLLNNVFNRSPNEVAKYDIVFLLSIILYYHQRYFERIAGNNKLRVFLLLFFPDDLLYIFPDKGPYSIKR